MRLAKRLGHVFLAGTCSLGAAAWAGEPADLDMPLTLAARKSISEDEQLAALNLGITVKAGVATIWGAVASDQVAQRAIGRVQAVAGMKAIQNELHVVTASEARALRRPEPVADSGLPAPVVLDATVRMLTPPAIAKRMDVKDLLAPEVVASAKPVEGTGQATTTAQLLAPITVAKPADPAEQIGRVWRSEKRFEGIQFELRQGVVRLSGKLQSWNDLWPFADAVSRIPGVERVLIEKVAVATK
ncbi:MAG: BON domain-containing protein [Gemmataceae bacterium]